MEVGHGILRKRGTVEETELRSSKRGRKLEDANFNQLDDGSSEVKYAHLPPITSVDACSENLAASNCSSELKHGELRSSELKVSNPAENSLREISKSLDDSFSGKPKQQMEESSTATKRTKRSKSMPRVNSSTAKMPTMEEIESFFSASEKYEQKRFSEKYNFDVVKDVPMEEGRYEWVQIK